MYGGLKPEQGVEKGLESSDALVSDEDVRKEEVL